MASKSSSWADQWDPEPAYINPATSNKNSKFSDKFDKTKAAASTGVRKAKAGATAAIQWVKFKYHKTTTKH
ncbi:hypothetical protein ABFS82_05G013000 [Erythranthe guttata]|uniref:Uncharacterized protein n=1 Tax=Erythranthe guttata TaxID=4155 RepID=A0A022Q7J0_ERYGU|nr:hypothetical protein MIMGU_mgv1a021725mg [Erythranthe guttata]